MAKKFNGVQGLGSFSSKVVGVSNCGGSGCGLGVVGLTCIGLMS